MSEPQKSNQLKIVNCGFLEHLTIGDIEFVSRILGKGNPAREKAVITLLVDPKSPETRDQVLDDPELAKALETEGIQNISSHLFFYLLLRPFLDAEGINSKDSDLDRSGLSSSAVAAYISAVLAETHMGMRQGCINPVPKDMPKSPRQEKDEHGSRARYDCISDALYALRRADKNEEFFLRLDIADRAFFIATILRERVKRMAEGKAYPDPKYYHGIGMTQYRLAGDHRLSENPKYANGKLGQILGYISKRFTDIGRAVVRMRQNHLDTTLDPDIRGFSLSNFGMSSS